MSNQWWAEPQSQEGCGNGQAPGRDVDKGNNSQSEESKEQKDDDKDALVLPTTFASWAMGVLGGKGHARLNRYIETEIFRQTSKALQDRTGVNVEWLIAAGVAAHSAQTMIPKALNSALEQVKTQTTSSIALGPADHALETHLLKLIRKQQEEASKPLFSLRGRHDERDGEGELQPRGGELKRSFRFNKTTFILDEVKEERNQDAWNEKKMVIRCFGHSNQPIVKLLEHIKAQGFTSEKLTVTKISAGSPGLNITSEEREKRLFSSVDLEPAIAEQILREVTDFFHKDTKKLYAETSRNWRHGFLFSGPPGTGKTSLSFAIASEAGLPLAIINLQGMNDQDLEDAFSHLPVPCVVLMEDIDTSAADTKSRSQPDSDSDNKEEASDQASQQMSKAEVTNMVEQALGQFKKELSSSFKTLQQSQEASHKEVINLLRQNFDQGFAQHEDNNGWGSGGSWATPPVTQVQGQPAPDTEKKITLSGLLNVIDGATATNGRLLIMTTNHPEHLDDALTRPGRCDSKFHIGYATPSSAEQTFKRIFGADSCKKHSIAAIERYAQAFKDQFPEHSRVATCDLVRYCALYRNRPIEAVRDFLTFLKDGMDMFIWKAEAQAAGKNTNKPRPFDETLLEEKPEDLVKIVVPEVVVEEEQEVKQSHSNPFRWLGGSTNVETAEKDFDLADVEHDEWPEFTLFGRTPSTVPPEPTEDDYQPALDLFERAMGYSL